MKSKMKEILIAYRQQYLNSQDDQAAQEQLESASDPDKLLDYNLSGESRNLRGVFRELREAFLPKREEMLDELRQAYSQQKPQLVTDFMGYNTAEPEHGPSGVNWAGDLILECEVQADAGQGQLTLELSRGVDRFRAKFDLSTGACTLTLIRNGQEKPLDSKPTALKGGGKHSVRFADVDQRLTVWVDEALPFGDGVTYDPPPTEGPTEKNDLEPASIAVQGRGRRCRASAYGATPTTPPPTMRAATLPRPTSPSTPATRRPGPSCGTCPHGPCTCSRATTSASATTARGVPTADSGASSQSVCCWARPSPSSIRSIDSSAFGKQGSGSQGSGDCPSFPNSCLGTPARETPVSRPIPERDGRPNRSLGARRETKDK